MSLVLLIALFILGFVVLSGVYTIRNGIPRYPGPRPLPIIGNTLPLSRVWLTLTSWSKQFGQLTPAALFYLRPIDP